MSKGSWRRRPHCALAPYKHPHLLELCRWCCISPASLQTNEFFWEAQTGSRRLRKLLGGLLGLNWDVSALVEPSFLSCTGTGKNILHAALCTQRTAPPLHKSAWNVKQADRASLGSSGQRKTTCHVTKAALDELGITGKSATCLPVICGTKHAPR